eukprot:scaffold2674_cov333-Prasinococcus_capsulatus_cf.AAC.5
MARQGRARSGSGERWASWVAEASERNAGRARWQGHADAAVPWLPPLSPLSCGQAGGATFEAVELVRYSHFHAGASPAAVTFSLTFVMLTLSTGLYHSPGQ